MIIFLGLVRGVHEASLMILFGSACLLVLLSAKVPELALEGGVLASGRRVAALAALVTAPVWLALTAAQMAGSATAMADSETLWQAVSATLFGQIFLARFLLLLLLTTTVWMGRAQLTAWLSGGALVLIAVTSHTASAGPSGFGFIGTASDGLHLLTGGYWIGSLCVLAVLLADRPAAPRLGLALSVFAEWGMIAVGLLVMTGMINAAMVLLGMPGHDALPYLAVLGLKLGLVVAMVALALVNHVRLLPRLSQTGIVQRLKLHVGWELGLGLAVIGLAMTLTLLPPTFQ
jgi:putative copper resistance protein D